MFNRDRVFIINRNFVVILFFFDYAWTYLRELLTLKMLTKKEEKVKRFVIEWPL